MAATLVAVSTSTRRRAAGWASGATCRLLEWRRGGWGRGCSTGVDPLAGNLAVCLYTTGHARVTRWALSPSLAFYVWLKSHHDVFLSVYHEYQKRTWSSTAAACKIGTCIMYSQRNTQPAFNSGPDCAFVFVICMLLGTHQHLGKVWM